MVTGFRMARWFIPLVCLFLAVCSAPAAPDQPLFGAAEIRVPPGGEETASFELTKKSVVELRFRARSDSTELGGMLSMLYVRVNDGLVLGAEQLMGRDDTLRFRSGKVTPAAPRNRLTLYHAPSFDPIPKTHKYYPVNLPDNDPFTFRLNITDFVKPGKNTVTFKHFKPQKKYHAIVVRDVAVRLAALDDLLADRAEKVKAEADKMRAVRLRLYDDTPTTDDTPEMLAAMRGMRMATWAYWNSGDLDEYPTPEAAAERARELKANGATVAIVRGRHFRLHYLNETDRLLKYYETVARACHDAGLTCFAHFDFVLSWQAGFPFLKQHDQLPQRSLHDGTPTRWLCCNNPALREAHTRYVEEIARRGIDGFMLDEINFIFKSHLHCGCEHCRRKFEEKTGYRLPEWDNPAVIGNPESPLWRLWQEWQAQTLTEFRLHMIQRMRKIRPGVVVLTYSTDIYSPTKSTGSVLENARVCFAGTEGSNLTFGSAPNLYAQHRMALAFTRLYGRPTWAQYPASSTEERIFGSACLAPVTGNGPWGWLRQSDDQSLARFFNWHGLDESMTWADPIADMGVLLSTVNRFGPPARSAAHASEASGWMQAFGMRGVQFNPIVGKYAKPADLAPYRAVVVPDCRMLPEPTVAAAAEYVREGGTLLVTGVPGRYDALGFPLGDASLLRRIGMRSVSAVDDIQFHRKKQRYINGVDRELIPEEKALAAAPRRVKLPQSYRFDFELQPEAKPMVLARFDDGGPAVCAWSWGKGRVIYGAFLPGQLSAQRRCNQASVVEAWHQPDVHQLMRALALEATAARDRVRVDGDGVLSSAWRAGNSAWVRMVNVSGLRALSVGKPIGKIKPMYPPLPALRVRVALPVGGTAQLVTPDNPREIPLPLQRDGEGAFFEIPPGAFNTFAFLRMEVVQ